MKRTRIFAVMLMMLAGVIGIIGAIGVVAAAPQTAPAQQTLTVTYYFLPG